HTGSPDAEDFRRLTDVLGSGEAAGQELLQRMRRFQVEQQGFSDIAQHVTIMPDGSVFLGRPWDRPPVSARGFNGSAARGPLMVALVGDFSVETPGEEVLAAAAEVIAGLRRAFSLP